jgi:hypothetical protein
MPLPNSRKKLLGLFSQITNPSIRTIISDVVSLENENRSSLRFPITKVEYIVDNEAKLIESTQENGGGQ